MARRRFFILDYTLSDDHIADMLCRVESDKYNPKDCYAPESTLVRELMPDILPKPNITTNRRECLESAKGTSAKLKLAKLFHLEGDRSYQDQTALESELVKRDSLGNASTRFKKLMGDARYAAEVSSVLEETQTRTAYLVDGFMTTTNATWSRGVKTDGSFGAGATLVVPGCTEVSGGGAEVAAEVAHSRHAGKSSEWIVPGEEIFAVSYLEVKLEGRGFFGRGPKVPVIGDTVVASNKAAALGHSDSGYTRTGEECEESGSDSSGQSDGEDEEGGEVVLLPDEEAVVEGDDDYLELGFSDNA